MAPVLDSSRFAVLADGLDHPEGVTWGQDGFIYTGGEAGQIYRVSLGGRVEQVATTGGFILGLCLDGDGNIYCCDTGNKAIMRVTPQGEVGAYFTGTPSRSLVNPNYAAFMPDGDLYFSDSGVFGEDNGCLWVVHPGGQGEVWRTDVASFPNGIAFGASRTDLYVVLSTLPGVVRVPLDGGNIEVLVRFERKVPDGLAFDQDGNMYISCYTPDQIWRVSPAGMIDLLAEDWQRTILAAPTNLAFCGPGLDILVVANLGRWHLARAEAGTHGLPYAYPHLGAGQS